MVHIHTCLYTPALGSNPSSVLLLLYYYYYQTIAAQSLFGRTAASILFRLGSLPSWFTTPDWVHNSHSATVPLASSPNHAISCGQLVASGASWVGELMHQPPGIPTPLRRGAIRDSCQQSDDVSTAHSSPSQPNLPAREHGGWGNPPSRATTADDADAQHDACTLTAQAAPPVPANDPFLPTCQPQVSLRTVHTLLVQYQSRPKVTHVAPHPLQEAQM